MEEGIRNVERSYINKSFIQMKQTWPKHMATPDILRALSNFMLELIKFGHISLTERYFTSYENILKSFVFCIFVFDHGM